MLLPLISGIMLGQELREDLTLAKRDGRDSAAIGTSDGVVKDEVWGMAFVVTTGETSIISASDSGMCEFRSRERGEAGEGRPIAEGGDGEREMEKRAARERNRFCNLLLAGEGFGEDCVELEIIRPPNLEICSI